MKQETFDFLTDNGYRKWREEETRETTKYEFRVRDGYTVKNKR